MRKTKVKYNIFLSQTDQVRIDFTKEKKKITAFMAQYEFKIKKDWIPVIRYDTSHGFAHCDKLYPDKTKKKIILHLKNWNKALTFAICDLKNNWEIYKNLYLKRKKEYEKTRNFY